MDFKSNSLLYILIDILINFVSIAIQFLQMNESSEDISQKRRKVDESHDNQQQLNNDKAIDIPLTFKVITNDGSPESFEGLINLKNIIARQLPKMPKEYIVRLVFDHRHYSLVICKRDRIIGGITYRPYFDQKFAEIAFCAINGTEQVKGYGTILMNQLKHHVQNQKIEFFLTYADNYALGYFQKQGFSKNVMMPKERWVGFIKDYDGGTLMECYIHSMFNYLEVNETVGKQRSFIYDCIQKNSVAEVYPGLDLFRNGGKFQSILDVPGVTSAGWSNQRIYKGSTERDRNSAMQKFAALLKTIVEKIKQSGISKQLKHNPELLEVPLK